MTDSYDPALQEVLDALGDAVAITDANLAVTVWNTAAEQLFGWSRDEAVGRSVLDLGIAPEDLEQASELAAQVLAGRPWEGSFPVRAKSGRPLIGRFHCTPLRDPHGAVTGIVVTARDALESRHQQQKALARLALMSRAGLLLGTSLEVDRTLAAIAELLVPTIADHCFIDLFDETGRLVRLVNVRAEQVDGPDTGWVPVGQQPRYPPGHAVTLALRAGRGVLLDDVRAGDAGGTAPGRASAERARGAGPLALIAVPLGGPRGVRGVLCVMSSARRYDADDLDMVEELAARAGLALDNAALYDRQRSLSLTLQRSLLPDELPRVDGVEVAYRYRPGTDAEVGGDFYDVIPLPLGRVGIVIGDVQGRGAHAAAVMGQVRAALRAYAVLDLPPAQLLAHLDELVQSLNDSLLVTCVFAVYDPFTRRCVVANAGNPTPLLVHPSAGANPAGPADAPLGMGGGVPYEQHEYLVPPGGSLLLYTDGVVERRDLRVDQGVNWLRALLSEPPGGPEELCDAALRAAPGDPEDDQAVLAVRTAEVELPMSRLVLPALPVSTPSARQHTREVLTEWGLKEHREIAELLVSELVANSVRHAVDAVRGAPRQETGTAARLELVLRRGRRALWCEVHDSDLRLPRMRVAGELDEGGRGLYLVDALSTRWGVRPTRRGKAVWFELAIDGDGSGPAGRLPPE